MLGGRYEQFRYRPAHKKVALGSFLAKRGLPSTEMGIPRWLLTEGVDFLYRLQGWTSSIMGSLSIFRATTRCGEFLWTLYPLLRFDPRKFRGAGRTEERVEGGAEVRRRWWTTGRSVELL